ARGCDGWNPDDAWPFDSRRFAKLRDDGVVVVDAVRRGRPTVVLAGDDAVDLVATARTMLVFPHRAVTGIDQQSLAIAVTVRVELRLRRRIAAERVGRRCNPIAIEPNDFPEVGAQRLSMRAEIETFADGQQHRLIGQEHDSAARMCRPNLIR